MTISKPLLLPLVLKSTSEEKKPSVLIKLNPEDISGESILKLSTPRELTVGYLGRVIGLFVDIIKGDVSNIEVSEFKHRDVGGETSELFNFQGFLPAGSFRNSVERNSLIVDMPMVENSV